MIQFWNHSGSAKAQIRARKTNKKLKCFSPKAQLTDQDDSKNTLLGYNISTLFLLGSYIHLDAFSLVS